MVEILRHQGVKTIIKWVDDFIFLCYPTPQSTNETFAFTYSADLIWHITKELGWPWAPLKFVDFSTSFLYIGFLWDLSAKRAELPKKKEAKVHKSPHLLDLRLPSYS